jgi:hypothetical protein
MQDTILFNTNLGIFSVRASKWISFMISRILIIGVGIFCLPKLLTPRFSSIGAEKYYPPCFYPSRAFAPAQFFAEPLMQRIDINFFEWNIPAPRFAIAPLAGGNTHPLPVGSPVARAAKPPKFNICFKQVQRMAVFGNPVG